MTFRLLWAFIFILSAVHAEEVSFPDTQSVAELSLRKNFAIFVDGIRHDPKTSDAAGRQQQIEDGARGIADSFFLPYFSDNTIPMRDRRAAIENLWESLLQNLENNPETLDPQHLLVLLGFIRERIQALKDSDEGQKNFMLSAFEYPFFFSAGGELIARISFWGWGRGVEGFKFARKAGSKMGKSVSKAWKERSVRKGWESFMEPGPAVETGKAKTSRSIAGFCAQAMKSLWGKRSKIGWFFLRHGVIAGVYSVPNYLFDARPFFWGFNNYEPADPIKDLAQDKIEPYFSKKLN